MNDRAANLALYHFESCPFCMRVRMAIKQMGLDIELRDIQKDPQHRDDLEQGGGKTQVPCLRIEKDGGVVQWMYESNDIIQYLSQLGS